MLIVREIAGADGRVEKSKLTESRTLDTAVRGSRNQSSPVAFGPVTEVYLAFAKWYYHEMGVTKEKLDNIGVVISM